MSAIALAHSRFQASAVYNRDVALATVNHARLVEVPGRTGDALGVYGQHLGQKFLGYWPSLGGHPVVD
jgi:hypothetical protein